MMRRSMVLAVLFAMTVAVAAPPFVSTTDMDAALSGGAGTSIDQAEAAPFPHLSSTDRYRKLTSSNPLDQAEAAAEWAALNAPPARPIASTLAWRSEEVMATILITAVVLFVLFVLWRLAKWFPSWISGNWRAQLAIGAVLCAASIGALLVVYAVDHGRAWDDWDDLKHPGFAFLMLMALAAGVGFVVYSALRSRGKT